MPFSQLLNGCAARAFSSVVPVRAAARAFSPLVPKARGEGLFLRRAESAPVARAFSPSYRKARAAAAFPPCEGGLGGGLGPLITRLTSHCLPSVSPFLAAWRLEISELYRSPRCSAHLCPFHKGGKVDGLHCRVGLSNGPPP